MVHIIQSNHQLTIRKIYKEVGILYGSCQDIN